MSPTPTGSPQTKSEVCIRIPGLQPPPEGGIPKWKRSGMLVISLRISNQGLGCSWQKKSIISGFMFDFRRSIESCRLARVPFLNSGRKLSLLHFKWYLLGVKYSHAHIGLLPTNITGTSVHRHPSTLTYLRYLKIAKFNPCVSKGWFFSIVFQLFLDPVFETSATFNIPST